MPVKVSKRKARQSSAQEIDDSPSSSFQRLETEKGSLTKEQVVGIIQHIEKKLAYEMKDEIKRTESTFLRALNSLSENSRRDGFFSNQENFDPGE